jgi:hypothetical protein
LQDDQAPQVIDDRQDRQCFQHTEPCFAVEHVRVHRGLELAQMGFDLSEGAVQGRQVIGAIARRVEQGRDQRDLMGSKPRRADRIPDLAHAQGHR